MRVARRVVLALLLIAAAAGSADPVYLDELIETPLATLQQQFPKLRREGCYQIATERYLMIEIDRKDRKPWRVVIASTVPCRRAEDGPLLDVRERTGIELGESTVKIVEKLGRPDASATPEAAQRRLGETEYLFMCRVSDGCARHTSVFVREGIVTAISQWYSE